MQDLFEYISNSSVFVVNCSWRTDVTCVADASPPLSAILLSDTTSQITPFSYECFYAIMEDNKNSGRAVSG